MRKKLTVVAVEQFTCPEGKAAGFLWDGEVIGLGVKASAGGSKRYFVQARLHGGAVRIAIGDVGTLPLDGSAKVTHTARSEARRLIALMKQGIDPREQLKEAAAKSTEAKAAKVRATVIVETAWQDYIKSHPKWGTLHRADHIRAAKAGGQIPRARGRAGTLAALMPLKLSDLTNERVKDWLEHETESRPTQAALAYRLLRAFVNWCSEKPAYRGLVSPEACTQRAIRRLVAKPKSKTDCLQREQLEAWFAAVKQIANPTIAAYLQVLLLTGARRNELATLSWANVDFRWLTLTIHDKVSGQRVIPLTPYAASLLIELKALNERPPAPTRILMGKVIANDVANWKPSPWVFASPKAASGYLQEPRIQHTKACAMAGIDGLTIHGLRRSFGTLGDWTDCPAGITAQIMGHKPSAIAEKHYRVRPVDMLREWHTKIERWFITEAGVSFDYSTTGKAHTLRVV
tara:strand:- start:7833 stop:9212 length:1380 start_codon:yes stop_codon:yes gene_type:complete